WAEAKADIGRVFHADVLLQAVIDVKQVFVLVLESIRFDPEWRAAIINANHKASAAAVQKGGDRFEPGNFDGMVDLLFLHAPAEGGFEFGSVVFTFVYDLGDAFFGRAGQQSAAFLLEFHLASNTRADLDRIERFG